MPQEIISLTKSSDSSIVYIPVQSFGYGVSSGGGTSVYYNTRSGAKQIAVNETPSEISVKSTELLVLTENSISIVLASESIVEIAVHSSGGAIVFYDFQQKEFIVSENIAVISSLCQGSAGVQTLTDGATIDWDVARGNIATVTLAGDRTLNAPTNLTVGTYVLYVVQDATGTRLITWNDAFKWSEDTPPTLSTGTGDIDVITFICKDGSTLQGVAQTNFS